MSAHALPLTASAPSGRCGVGPRAARSCRSAILVLCASASLANPLGDAGAQVFPQLPELEPAPAAVGPPGPMDAREHLTATADSAALATHEITRLGDTRTLLAELEATRRGATEVQALLATLGQVEYVRPERFGRLRDRAVMHQQRAIALEERLAGRVEALTRLQEGWSAQRQYWREWWTTVEELPEAPLVEPELRRALDGIDTVLTAAQEVLPEIRAVQAEAAGVRAGASEFVERIAVVQAGRREALVSRDQPILFAPAFLGQLREALTGEWRPLEPLRTGAYAAFFRDNWRLLAFHLLLALVLGMLGRRLARNAAPPDEAWSGLLRHPWASALFATTVAAASQYRLPPGLWDVAMWSLLAASSALLAGRLLPARATRLVVYFFAAFYPAFLLAEAIQLPAPLFRLGLAGTAAAGVLVFGLLQAAERETAGRVRFAPGAAAVMWAVVLGAEVLGFYLLARWILHATVTSGLVVFTVVFLLVLSRGAIQRLVRIEAKGSLRFLRRVGVPLVERVVLILQVVLVLAATLAVLAIWEITPSPLETWPRLLTAGVTVAGAEITVGRILFALLLVYLAAQVSWFLRTVANSELYRRWQFERGVGESINTLLHYAILTAGFLFALGALGVRLQNFAIIAGALGVGIGFGLQNVVNNFVSGLILLFERPVRVGDTVVIDAEWGTVKKIGLRSTVVLTFDQAEMVVPNADLISEKVTNWTLSDPVARLVVPVGVAYGSDISRVLDLLGEAAWAHPAVLDEPPPRALFTEFGDSALEFELRVWVREIRVRLEVRSAVLAEVDRLFRGEGIEIPFPQRDLHLRSIDTATLEAVRGRGGITHDGGAGAQTLADSSPAREADEER